jgi:ABC-type nitrate/sulfonate/bicarbonate transport system permease component
MSRTRLAPAAGGIALAVVRKVVMFLLVIAVIVIIWWALLAISGVSPFVAKSPADVWGFYVTDPEAAQNRAFVLDALLVTAHDAGIGYLVGLGGAFVIAVAFALIPALGTTFRPVAMVLRTFPLVALTPLVILAFGRGDAGLAAIGFIVVFFSALITISYGIASAPRDALEVVAAFGGRRWARVWKVGVPAGLPAFFAAARIAIPAALSAALIAEWLVTGTGAGSELMRAAGTSQYTVLWSLAVAFILATTVVYTIVSTIEEAVLARVDPSASRKGNP